MDSTTVIVTQIVTLITVVIGFFVALYRENRNRRWDLEDRARARAELLRKTDKLTEASIRGHENTVNTVSQIIRSNIDANLIRAPEVEQLLSRLDEAIEKADSAYSSIGKESIKNIKEVKSEVHDVKELTKDTNVKVTDLKNKINPSRSGF